MNPAQGFLASANQQPVDPRVNHSYMGSDWYSPWRAMRINSLLRADSAVTPDEMRDFKPTPAARGQTRSFLSFLPLQHVKTARADQMQRSAKPRRSSLNGTAATRRKTSVRCSSSLRWSS